MKDNQIDYDDCLSVADDATKAHLSMITNFDMLKDLVKKWCDINKYNLGAYEGKLRWHVWPQGKLISSVPER
jgi:hypothetical protein